MDVKLAIAHRVGSYSEHWIKYCEDRKIPFCIVDPAQSDIVDQVRDCDGFLWHWNHSNVAGLLFARQLIYSLETMGIRVFPNSNTVWHYDDKVGQKYFLESLGLPLVPTHVFYDRKTANQWIDTADFPKVFKLRGGASSVNVRLVSSKREAKRLTRQAFGRGFRSRDYWGLCKERMVKLMVQPNRSNAILAGKALVRSFIPSPYERIHPKERGYIYFQDFCAENEYDTRITVIGDRAFGFRRFVRSNDFRASGSGKIDYTVSAIDPQTVRIAFDLTQKMGIQSCAFDFMYDIQDKPVIGEISYCYMHEAVAACSGYWDPDLKWHEGQSMPAYLMLENLVHEIVSMRLSERHKKIA